MPLWMARPMQINGIYYFRQRVPRDLVPVVGRQFVKESLKTGDRTLAKVRHSECLARYAAWWDELRRNPRGLEHREVVAISGAVYREFLDRHRDRFRDGLWSKHHWVYRSAFLDMATGVEDAAKWNIPCPDWPTIEMNAGESLKTVLQKAGMAVDETTYRALLFESGKAVSQAIRKILNECDGDYGPDPRADRFGEFVPPVAKEKKSPLAEEVWKGGCQVWGRAAQRKYREKLDDFLGFLEGNGFRKTRGDYDLSRVTPDHVRAWRDHVMARADRAATARTVQREYLGSLKAVFSYAVRSERIGANPADKVFVEAAWGQKGQTKRGFHDDEAEAILRASRRPLGEKTSRHVRDAIRWVPWLLAYTGARVSEATQLRAKDVRFIENYWCIHITPEAGAQKTDSDRYVPLHPHVIEEGFLEFWRQHRRPTEPLFHTYEMPECTAPDQIKAHRERAAKRAEGVSGRVSKWVRGLPGLKEKGVDPNHGWRHRFETEGRAVPIEERFLDSIQGHIPPGMGGKYGAFPPRITGPLITKMRGITLDDEATSADAN